MSTSMPPANEVHRERIAADLAAWEACGGRVQVLSVGDCSRPLKHADSRYAEKREKGRVAHQRTRAGSKVTL